MIDGTILWPLVVILLLILANGVFSAAEIAIVTVRESRLVQLAKEGRPSTTVILELKRQPSRFLATVQVGVTIVGSMASVLGGAYAATRLASVLEHIVPPALAPWTPTAALAGMVAVISYLSLVVGELLPKSLALRNPERIAFATVHVIRILAAVSAPLVRLLTLSTDTLLKVLGVPTRTAEVFITEEEVKHIVQEGARHGIFDEAERQLIHSVFEFTDTSVREVMVPRSEIHALEETTALNEALCKLVETGFSRMPVYQGDLDHIVGIVHLKDILRELDKPKPVSLREIAHPAFFVPDSMQISDLLRELQARRVHMAVVVNEFGTVVGLVTIEDLLEEIVGEIRDEFDTDEEQPIQEMPDGSLLVQGSLSLDELTERYDLPFRSTPDYRTVAGLVLARFKRFPKGGEAIVEGPYKMTVVVLDGRRLRKIRIEGPIRKRAETRS
ncbi:MAG: hemolysin family protein [Candidatus Binatia bacterium]|nr:hemolysin family protein [Candidatus Binatia bacterium]